MTRTSQVALVTGASAGLGRACADRLAADGWTVAGASRRGTSGDGWTGLSLNVDDDAAVRAAVGQLHEQHGRIDALVAAAGWGVAGAAETTPLDAAKAQFETNFWGCVRTTQAVLPLMREQGGGRIVLVSSIGGVIGIPFQAFYSASKFALEGFGEALAYEVAPFGVHVTLVQPGNFRTDFTASRQKITGDDNSSYAAAQAKAVSLMERDEANGAAPQAVAAVVLRILAERKPPRRVSVGKVSERAGLVARRVLPFRLFEAGAKGSLGVD